MLPQLRELEQRFGDALVVVGIHSGKYTTERLTPRIREAALRLGVHHPVVNDRQFRVWRAYAVNAWPTIVAIDPAGKVVGMHAGEFTADAIAPFLEGQLAIAREAGTLRAGTLAHEGEASAVASGMLRYPGKVAVHGERMAIADTGHHRVLVGTLDAAGRTLRVERALGAERGWEDGGTPRFDQPQGLRFDGDTLWVADAGSHTLRAVDLSSGTVRTVAGIGRQARSGHDLGAGALASPWDLALHDRTLFIAMAGIHQLWSLDLEAPGARARPFAGSRAEDIVDGPHAEAALAQPMGLDAHDGALWFTDAESSAVRRADVDPAGRVETVIGTGLFDFGDADGRGDAVRMQHQQAIVRHPDGRLLVADSYNDALKWVDPATREATTWLRGFHEPAGLALGPGADPLVYVADTNAHRVCVVSPDGAVDELRVE